MARTLTNGRWSGHEKLKIVCAVCGEEFTTFPSAVKRGVRCCSSACRNVARIGRNAGEKNYQWQGGPVKRVCTVCSRDFYVKREQIRRTGAKFCSLNCRSIYNVRYKHGSQSTDIENITEELLIRIGVPYQKQVPIDNIALVDFLLPSKKIIQCVGDYWHSLPLTRERDERQDRYFAEHGYVVLRLRGSEIKKNRSYCLENIKRLTVENRADNVGLKGV